MKKLLLTFAVAAVGLSASAQDITQSFTKNFGLPTCTNSSYPTEADTATDSDTGITYTVLGAGFNSGGYLSILGSTRATNLPEGETSYISWTLPIDCQEVEITTSKSTGAGIVNFYAGDNAISQENGGVITATTQTESTFTVKIPEEYQKAGTVYKLKQAGAPNLAITKMVYVEAESDDVAVARPSISFDSTTNTVTIVCETEGANIFYTTNGDEPSTTSTKYNDAFTISENTTVKAIAELNNQLSSVASLFCTYYGTYDGFEAYIAAAPATGGKVTGDLTAIYQNGTSLYMTDNKGGYILVYGSLSNFISEEIVNGDAFTYVEGTYTTYGGLPEMKPTGISEKTAGTAIEPETITVSDLADATLSSYVKIEQVTISDATANNNYTITDTEGNSAVLHNSFYNTISVPTDDAYYTIVGFVNVYNSTPQITPISIEEYVAPVEPGEVAAPAISFDSTTNTVSIACDEEDAVIYYTIDGETPDNTSTEYEAPFAIKETVTVKAIAYVGDNASQVVSRTCTYYGTYDNYVEFVEANPSNGGKIEGPITIIYVNGTNIYTIDSEDNYMLLYGKKLEAEVEVGNGSVLSYVEGTYSPYNGLPEIRPTAFGELSEGTPVEPILITLDKVEDTDLNAYVKIENVKITLDNGRYYTMTDDEDNTATLYNTFYNSFTVPTTENYCTVEGFVAVYNDSYQISPISIVEEEESAIGSLNNAVEGENVIYTLQGVRVNNPAKGGIYIINGKKVLVK